jgi:hypothetical protein
MIEILNKTITSRPFREGVLQGKVECGNEKLVVITGDNASGKSLFRKILHLNYQDQKITLVNTSQQGRSESGIVRAMMYGSEADEATGAISTKVFLKAIETGKLGKYPMAILFDEPEIGCSEEVQMAMGIKLASSYLDMKVDCTYIISHSRQLLKQLAPCNPTHVRLGNFISFEEYLNREVIPYDLELLNSNSVELWRKIEKMKK